MKRETNLGLVLAGALGLAGALACVYILVRDDPNQQPFLQIAGTGFIFNYRVSDIYVGFTAMPQRPIPVGSRMRVTFTNPADGSPMVVEEQVGGADRRIAVRSPSMRGVKAGTPYPVTISLMDRETGAEFASQTFTVKSNIDDRLVPDEPLTVGPGYHRFDDHKAPAGARKG